MDNNPRTVLINMINSEECSEEQRFAAKHMTRMLIKLTEGYQKVLAEPPGSYEDLSSIDLFSCVQDIVLEDVVNELLAN